MTTTQRANEDQRRQMIADAAYSRAERRGFDGGDPVTDWLEAEADIDTRLRGGKRLLEELDERLAVANERLRAFKKKLSGMKADVREEWTHDVEKLAKLRDKFQKKLDEIRTEGEHASEKAKAQADKIWHEISDVIERVSSRKSGRTR
jgi:DNA anti-recombination protein RmuC